MIKHPEPQLVKKSSQESQKSHISGLVAGQRQMNTIGQKSISVKGFRSLSKESRDHEQAMRKIEMVELKKQEV